MDTNIIKKDIQPNIWLLIEEYNTTYEAILAVVNMKEHVTLQRCNQQNPDYNFTGQAVWFLQQINCKEGEKQVNSEILMEEESYRHINQYVVLIRTLIQTTWL